MPIWTYTGSTNYNALQIQLNRRIGKLQWNANYTWSRTIIYSQTRGDGANVGAAAFTQFIDNGLTKNVTNRPHAMNFNFGYEIPGVNRFWKNAFTRLVFDGWRFNGNGAIYSGLPFTVGCTAQGQPAGYWTGTPTGGIPFRCQMGNDIYLPSGQFPSATEDPRLQYAFNRANFTLPGINSLGIGNTPPTLLYGPGVVNFDLSLAKEFKFSESRSLEFRVEAFNTFNHFNPNNPNSGLTYNFATGAQTNAAFGAIQGAAVQSRRAILSARFKF